MGIGGVEYHGHTWELGPRKAGDPVHRAPADGAAGANGWSTGWCHHATNPTETSELARQIASMPAFGCGNKRRVNQTLDVQGSTRPSSRCSTSIRSGYGNALSVGGYPALADLACDEGQTAVRKVREDGPIDLCIVPHLRERYFSEAAPHG